MAYSYNQRTYGRRRRYIRRRRYGRKREMMPVEKPPTWQKLANATINYGFKYGPTIASAVKHLTGIINSELKYLDVVNITPAVISSAGTFVNLTAMAQGDTQSTRNGISQMDKSLFVKMVGWMNPGVANQQYLRYIVFVWNDNVSQNAPALADILENTTSPILSPLNIEESKYYSIIRDKTITMCASSPSSAYEIKDFIKLAPLHSKYSSTTAASATFGHVYLLLVSDSSVNGPYNAYDIRLRYYDN